MGSRPSFLENSLIIAAHPDDELLWFNAILKDIDEVLLVYGPFWAKPELGTQRAAALAEHPHPRISSLDLPESGAYGCANWLAPTESPHGITLNFETHKREAKRLSLMALTRIGAAGKNVAADSITTAYETNFERLCAALRTRLRPGMNVFAHNPWGEYGHEEHVQVFRALQILRREIGFVLWMSNYCTNRSLPLAMQYFQTAPSTYLRLPTDKAYAESVADVYKRHDCWTWADDWSWFDEECYMQAPDASIKPVSQQHLFPLNLFTIDVAPKRNLVPMAIGLTAGAAALVAAVDF